MTWFQKPPLGTPLDWENPLNERTKLHLAMNEGHGDKVQDLSMNGNHGTLNNFSFPPTAASGWNPGQAGVGLNFDGVDDYVDCGTNASLNNLGTFTISAIIKPTGVISTYGIMGRDIPLYLGLFDANTIRLRHSNLGDGTTEASHSIPTDTWTCIIATWDGSDTSLYADGVYVGGEAAVGTMNITANMAIGDYKVGGGWDFCGGIDQPRIQSRAWTAKEVRDYAMNPWRVYLDEDDR